MLIGEKERRMEYDILGMEKGNIALYFVNCHENVYNISCMTNRKGEIMKIKHVLIFMVVLLLDQITKFVVDATLVLHQRNTIIPGFFHLTYMRNTGAAWSMLEGKMWFFYIITVLALIAMFLFYRNQKDNEWIRIALILMIAGTFGNFIDRLCFQYVRDFLDFVIFGYDFPVFNVADMALCIGVFLIIVDALMDQAGVVRKR